MILGPRKMKKHFIITCVVLTTALFGVGSLIFLSFFLFAGEKAWISTGMSNMEKLLWDTFLCFAFFVQHSLMIRRSFKQRLEAWIPELYQKSFYSIVSGCVLIILIILWQPVPKDIITVPDWISWCFKGLLFFTGLIILFCSRVLSGMEVLGVRSLIHVMSNEKASCESPQDHLIVKGPYRWIRHPLYLSFLIIAWATPRITASRLLFNVLWTLWVCFAIRLEEKDLIACFGDSYREYQKKVPMIVPTSIRPSV